MPVVAALVVLAVPRKRHEIHLPLGVVLSLAPLGLAAYLFWQFEPVAGMQFVVDVPSYEPWGIGWRLGMDGISMPMVVLTAPLVPIALRASTAIPQATRECGVLTPPPAAGLR